MSSGDKGAEPPAVRPDLGEDKEAGVAAAIRQTGLRLRNYGLGGDMAAAGRMKRAWGGMSRWEQASSQDAAYARSARLDEGKEAMECGVLRLHVMLA